MIHKNSPGASATNASAKSALPTRFYRLENGLMKQNPAPPDLLAELSRTGYERIPTGETPFLSSFKQRESVLPGYAVIVHTERFHTLVLIGSIAEYAGWMRKYAPVVSCFDELLEHYV